MIIRDSATSTDIKVEKGLYTHVGGSYTFPFNGTYDTIKGKVGAASVETDHGDNQLQATFTYEGGKTLTQTSATFSYASSNIPFEFRFDPNDLVTVKLEVIGTLACSASVINDPIFATSNLKPIFDILKVNSWSGQTVRDEGNCQADFAAAKALVLALGEEDLAEFRTSDNEYVAAGRARYEAWASACGENPYSSGADALGVSNAISGNAGTAIVAIGLFTVIATAALLTIRKRKRDR